MNDLPNLSDDLVAVGAILEAVTPPEAGWPAELGQILTRLRLEGAVRNGRNALSPYTRKSAGQLYHRWRPERSCYQSAPEVTHVRANMHIDDLPTDPAQIAAAFASLPDGARVFADDENPGWIEASWTEPSTDEDRAKMEAELTAARRAELLADEERMAKFLEKQIPILTREMVKEEIPAAERKDPNSRKPVRRSTTRKSSTSAKRSTTRKSTTRKKAAK